MKAVLWDGKKILEDYALATPQGNREHFLIMLKALINPLMEKAKENKNKVQGIGVGIAGLCDEKGQKIVLAPNIPILNGFNLSEKLKEEFDLPVLVDNDANCFLRAEVEIGAVKKYNNVLGITIGTGVGGSWWINKEIYKGFRGGSMELGRMVIDSSGEIEAIYQRLGQGNSGNLAEEAYRGDILAQKTFEEIGYYLGVACANAVNLLDPEAVVLGGGLLEADDLFLPKLRKTAQELIMHPGSKNIKILKAKLGKSVGATGAAIQIYLN